MKKAIPNLVTLLNLFFGCCAIVGVLYGDPPAVMVCYLLAGLMDFADGFVARALGVSSPVGKELDSLADMVSFGVVPGMIFFFMLGGNASTLAFDRGGTDLFPFLGFIFSMAACYRLAKFNLDTRQTLDFIGMNTPTATGFVIGLLLIGYHDTFGWGTYVTQPLFLLACLALFSWLMISEIPMFSGKFRPGGWRANWMRYVFLVLIVLEIIFLGYAFFAIGVFTYLLLSFIAYFTEKKPV